MKNIDIKRAVRYVIVGGFTATINFGLFVILCNRTPFGESSVKVTVCNIIATMTSIIFAYIANKHIVFKSKTTSKKELYTQASKFICGRLGTMVIDVAGVAVCVTWLNMDEVLAKLLVQIFVIVGNYVISKFIVFESYTKNNITEIEGKYV